MKIRKSIIRALMFLIFIILSGCAKGQSGDNNLSPVCGDGICSSSETAQSCPDDCNSSQCGNGVIDDGEVCDSENLDSKSCSDLGFDGGTLVCSSDCKTFETSSCTGCPNSCDSAGSFRCNGDAIEICTVSNNCLSWDVDTDCSLMSKTCDDSTGTPTCSIECTNECTNSGDVRCTDNLLEICNMNAAGCLIWNLSRDCESSGLICDEGGGSAHCSETCSDTCTNSGDFRCTNDIKEICETGTNGCLGWATDTDCASIGKVCTNNSCECALECSPGDFSCNGTNLEICSTGGDGCPVYLFQEDCTATGKICSNNACECPTGCTLDTHQCNGNTTQICSTNTNGCAVWTTEEDCTASNRTCSSGSCICNDQCTSGQHQCNVNTTQDCVQDTNGCWDWQDNTDCAASNRTCSGGSCICNDQCTSGQHQCNVNTTQDCVQDTNGCWDWQDNTNCTTLTQTCLNGVCSDAPLDDYVRTTFSGGYSHTEAHNVGNGDDTTFSLSVPFTFLFYGNSYTQIYISTNGWISFGVDPGTSNSVNGHLVDSTAPHQAIYPWWDDLLFDSFDCPISNSPYIYYDVLGTAPNRVLIIDFYEPCDWDSSSPDGRYAFQIKLYETSNIIELLYDCSNWDTSWDSNATVGIEDDAQTDRWDEIQYNSGCPSSNYRYTPAVH